MQCDYFFRQVKASAEIKDPDANSTCPRECFILWGTAPEPLPSLRAAQHHCALLISNPGAPGHQHGPIPTAENWDSPVLPQKDVIIQTWRWTLQHSQCTPRQHCGTINATEAGTACFTPQAPFPKGADYHWRQQSLVLKLTLNSAATMKHFARAGPEAAAVTGMETNLCLWRWEKHAWNPQGKASFTVLNNPAAGRASTMSVSLSLLSLPSTTPKHSQGR